ncbi:DUF4198 domain-containing protein [Hoeflea sp. Naph1]|uniref:DUF4198 domain-containing protein n=1 Tax=Hoeflea sp. Naph1 TaxID=3388653 RepID=UPI0039901F88
MTRQTGRIWACAFLGLMGALSPVSAHEFWLEPQDFTVAPDSEITADLRVGQNFKGDAFPFIPSRFQSFMRYDHLGEISIEGTAGDIPALTVSPRGEGLTIVTYVSVGQQLLFRDWVKFGEYLALEGLDTVAARHDARGLPRDRITEIYTRCAKTLINVGDASNDQDHATGMQLELIAGQNPAALTPGAEMSFTLLWEGQPSANRQVALFRRDDKGDALRTLTRTDDNGVARFIIATAGTYLAAAVQMTEPSADQDVDWQSFWASLSFGVED